MSGNDVQAALNPACFQPHRDGAIRYALIGTGRSERLPICLRYIE
jgi:hypothetical protein